MTLGPPATWPTFMFSSPRNQRTNSCRDRAFSEAIEAIEAPTMAPASTALQEAEQADASTGCRAPGEMTR